MCVASEEDKKRLILGAFYALPSGASSVAANL